MVKSSETERKERMDTSSLMKQILSSDNLNRAYLQVVRNKGAEGVDGIKYTELKEHLVKDGEIIKEQLRTRKYKPQPVRRVEIPKPDGGVRNLGVPTVTDRFIQQAIAQVLTPIYEEQFHDHSYGFRPNRCAQQAILTALDHGTSEAVLQADVGHFWGTSLPVGGESTHDKEHDGELIETLQAYLDCDKSANKAAEKLYVNYRTLSGRLKKIKDISGIDFKNSAEMLAVRNGIVLFKMAETL